MSVGWCATAGVASCGDPAAAGWTATDPGTTAGETPWGAATVAGGALGCGATGAPDGAVLVTGAAGPGVTEATVLELELGPGGIAGSAQEDDDDGTTRAIAKPAADTARTRRQGWNMIKTDTSLDEKRLTAPG